MKLFSSVITQVCLQAVLTTLVASEEDLYKILGVERTATDKEISKAFRKLAQKYHPDHNKDPNAEDKFIEIARAYEILGDVDKRREYDAMSSGGGSFGQQFAGNNNNWHSHNQAHFNMHDFFSDFDPFGDLDNDFFNFHNAFHRSFHNNAHERAHSQAFAQAQAAHRAPFAFSPFFSEDMHTESSNTNGNCRTTTIRNGNTVTTHTVCG